MNSPAVPGVLYVLKRYPRLSETFIVREILGLESLGVRIGIASLTPPEPGVRHPEADLVRATVHTLHRRPRLHQSAVLRSHLRVVRHQPLRWARVALSRRGRQWRVFVQAGLVADRALSDGFGHLHAHFATSAAEVARDASALTGLPFTVTAHAKDVFHQDNMPRLPERLSAAAAIVTVSQYNVDQLRRLLPGRRITLVRNAMALCDPIAQSPEPRVLCVARLVDKKGIDTLIRAFATVIERRPDARLDIVGDGPLRVGLEAHAARLGIMDSILFHGALASPEVAGMLDRAAVFALPCRIAADGDRDGMPTVLLEAMARALPVVSTDIVGISEAVSHGVTGLLVPPDDAPRLADAIGVLLDDPARARSIGLAARRFVADRFAPTDSAEALLRVFAGATAPVATHTSTVASPEPVRCD